MQNEIRRNPITGHWVIYSRARSARPHDFAEDASAVAEGPPHDAGCPFCPGNEAELGEVVLELPGPEPHGWSVRVIPNRYPALSPHGGTARRTDGLHQWLDGHGRHEVIIESPWHNRPLARMDDAEIEAVLDAYHQRYHAYSRLHHGLYVVIFRNHGPHAGTSLSHPHSQAVVTPVVPLQVRHMDAQALEYYDRMGRCLMCALLEQETRQGQRILYMGEHFACMVPFAAESPFEMWIVPRAHQADFGAADGPQRAELARCLGRMLRLLRDRLGDPSYNYVIVTPPRFRRHEPGLHWYLRITPRLTTRAGFEIGSGMAINPRLPEDDAAHLLGRG